MRQRWAFGDQRKPSVIEPELTFGFRHLNEVNCLKMGKTFEFPKYIH